MGLNPRRITSRATSRWPALRAAERAVSPNASQELTEVPASARRDTSPMLPARAARIMVSFWSINGAVVCACTETDPTRAHDNQSDRQPFNMRGQEGAGAGQGIATLGFPARNTLYSSFFAYAGRLTSPGIRPGVRFYGIVRFQTGDETLGQWLHAVAA